MDTWLINGEPGSAVPVTDRGFAYGDGVFETIAVRAGKPRLLDYHLERLADSCRRLDIRLPPETRLADELASIVDKHGTGSAKIIVTRGSGRRGYRPPAGAIATRVIGFADESDQPPQVPKHGIEVRLCQTTLGRNPALAGLKTLGRLEQVLARQEWHDPLIAEGLMRDSEGFVVCGTRSNLFLVTNRRLLTPRLDRCGVRGVMRRLVMEQARILGLSVEETDCTEEAVHAADGLFVTNALIGLQSVALMDGRRFEAESITRALRAALSAVGIAECDS